MSLEQWTSVEEYITGQLLPPDAALNKALEDLAAAGMPAISVAPNEGKLLHLLARIHGAKNILEVGTLGGYSTIWLARALPLDGKMITLEADPKHAQVAKANIARAHLSEKVDVRVGLAANTLPELEREGRGPFDFIFIDADKPSNPVYFGWALKLSRPGTVIIVDNVVRNGAVADESSQDPSILGVRKLNEMMAAEPRVTATAIQTVGSKGYDGFAMALVLG